MRYLFEVSYFGENYSGWQRQPNAPSVQQELEDAISTILRKKTSIVGSGRTDTGVHAIQQFFHLDLKTDAGDLKYKLNSFLPDDIAILRYREIKRDAHARFSATGRRYVYRIISRRAPLTVERQRAWNVKIPLDVEAMDQAAKILLGEHDFTTFRSTECQAKSPVKTLDTLDVAIHSRHGLDIIEITTTARSFLHNQVRSIAGCLKAVGEGKWNQDDLAAALEARDRTACAPVAPAHGLYLVSVRY